MLNFGLGFSSSLKKQWQNTYDVEDAVYRPEMNYHNVQWIEKWGFVNLLSTILQSGDMIIRTSLFVSRNFIVKTNLFFFFKFW